jgi:hypothetical protein
MFSIKLRSFGFIAPKTWVTLVDVLYQAYKTKGPKLYSEHRLRSPMF